MLRRFLLLFTLCLSVSARAQTPERELAQADAAWQRNDFAAAEKHCERALKGAQGDDAIEAPTFFGRGLARLQLQKWQGARDDLTASIERDPNNAEAFASRGMARKALGDYTGLLADAHEEARLDPEYENFEDDAKSTVLWRRSLLGFVVLGCVLLCVALLPMVRSLTRAARAEWDAKSKH